MNAYPELSLLFDEDRLPPGQQPIVTAGCIASWKIVPMRFVEREIWY
jgi:hypothetical protein